jgi:phage terminase Nu1 subunit (DNA packaging protein)
MAELLTQRAIAEYLDLDARQIRNLEKLGLPTRKVGGEKRYPWPSGLHWYIKYKTAAGKKQTTSKRLEAAKLRSAEAKAEQDELDLFERQARSP